MVKYALFKGLEGTLWENIELVTTGDLQTVLNSFTGRDNDYILWWLIDIEKLPAGKSIEDVPALFLKTFIRDQHKEYYSEFVAGFYDDIAKNRSWGLLIR